MKIQNYSDFKDERIDESFWEDIKYGLSKLGRYKAGGKIFGKKETDDKSREEIEQIMNKESNKLLKKVHDEVLKEAPEFPNNRKKFTFLRGIILYGQLYDSLVAAAKKNSNEEGYMAPEIVNEIILDMRKVIKKYLDVDLKAIYSVAESKEDDMTDEEMLEFNQSFSEYDAINEEEEFIKKLTQLKDKAMDKLFGAKKGTDAIQKTTKGQSAKLQKTSGETNVDSERMKTLQSNKLPLVLAGVGGALGALGWLAQTEWMKNCIIEWFGGDKVVTDTKEIVTKITGGPADEKGLIHWMSEINKAQGGGDIKTGADVTKFINKFGGVDNMQGFFIGNGGGDAMKQAQVLQQVCSGNPAASVGSIFTKAAGMFGSMKGGQNLFGISKQANFVGTTIKTQATKHLVKGAGTAIAAKVAGIGKLLSGIGIGLVATGALVKLLREKGQRQSRAKTLDNLLQSLVLVEVPSKKEGSEKSGDEKGGQKEKEGQKEIKPFKSMYPTMIKNLKALQSMLISFDGVKLEGTDSVKQKSIKTGDRQRIKPDSTFSGMNRQKVRESYLILKFEDLLLEKEFTKQPRNVEIKKDETYLTQAFQNISKSIKTIKDEKDKGIGVTEKFIGDILSEKMNAKEVIKDLYLDIYEHLYGKYSKTLADFGPLYKESVEVISKADKRKVVAEKIARLAKRTQQFEGEGFYGGLGEFGADMEEFNTSLKEIMESIKSER